MLIITVEDVNGYTWSRTSQNFIIWCTWFDKRMKMLFLDNAKDLVCKNVFNERGIIHRNRVLVGNK